MTAARLVAVVAVSLVVLNVPATAAAQEMPELLAVSPRSAAANPSLSARRDALAVERTALRSAIEKHNAECGSVEEDSPEDHACLAARASLAAERGRHIADTNTFNAAVRAARELDAIDARIARLEKAVRLLSGGNPAWEKNRQELADHARDDWWEAGAEAANLASLGLAEYLKMLTADQLRMMKSVALVRGFAAPLAQLPGEERRVRAALEASKDVTLTAAALRYLAALHRLDVAREANDVAEALARARDAAEALRDEFDIVHHLRERRDPYEFLYTSSLLVGRLSLVFAKGVAGETFAIGSAGSSVVVGGRALVNVWEDRQLIRAAAADAARREQKRGEVTAKLADLRQERERLLSAIGHRR